MEENFQLFCKENLSELCSNQNYSAHKQPSIQYLLSMNLIEQIQVHEGIVDISSFDENVKKNVLCVLKTRFFVNARKADVLKCIYCNNQCQCLKCLNTIENQEFVQQERQKQYLNSKLQIGCNCSKSMCLKKYCECFSQGKLCSSICNCIDCKNTIYKPKKKKTQNQPLIDEMVLKKHILLNNTKIHLSSNFYENSMKIKQLREILLKNQQDIELKQYLCQEKIENLNIIN